MRGFDARRRRAGATALAVVAAIVGGVAVATPASAVAASGRAVIVDGAGSSTSLGSGGSATSFSLRLPGHPECPGDSEDGNYRVQGFIVPASADPGAMRWNDIAPVVPGGYALYDVNTNPYSQALTAKAAHKGGPGPIINIPSFSFGVFVPPGRLVPGRYHIGIACSIFNVITRYWATDIAVSRVASDRPAELQWRALDAAPAGGHGGSGETAIVLAGALVLLAAALGGRRMRARWAGASREPVRRAAR
jgi:hypothetical protein